VVGEKDRVGRRWL